MSEVLNENINPEVNEPNTTPETADKTSDIKTFTQDEVNELLAKRLDRERKKYSDYDTLKAQAEQYAKEVEERRLAEMSEKERAEELAKKFEQEKSDLARQLEELRTQAQSEKIHNEFIKVATSQNIAYIDDALRLADLSAVTIGEDGKVVGVEDAVKALVDNKPFLLARKQPKPIGESSNGGKEIPERSADQLLAEAAAKAKASGRIEDKVAYATLKAELGR